MAIHDNHTTGTRNGYLPYIIGAVVLVAALFYFMGDSFTARTTAPPTTTSVPQTAPAPATK